MKMKSWLVRNGFDGLYVAGTCACLVDDLGPCGSLPSTCKPGYKHMDPRPEHVGSWAVFGGKETPDEDEWEYVGY